MAEELRDHLIVGVTEATTDSDGEQLINTSDKLMHIRRIRQYGRINSGAGVFQAQGQVAKSNSLVSADGATEQIGGAFSASSSINSQGVSWNQIDVYPKGAFTLEPGEALHQHWESTSTVGSGKVQRAHIKYHY